ncbi:MAG: hypothetical protein IPP98_15525 [Gemmatimonadetes bacterium]|nr:hypothetical protein [Gemmatimonadota bacterium]
MTSPRWFISFAGLMVLAACSDRAPSATPLPTWTLREEWRVGGEAEGPHSFDANFGVAMLPGDTLIHFDYQDQRFHLLDRNGQPVRSFGRKGTGPGELADANGFVVTQSGLIIAHDRGTHRLSRFDAAGRALGSVVVPSEYRPGVRWDAQTLDDGRLLERYATIVDSLGTGVWFDRARLWATDLASSEEVKRDSCMVSHRPAGGQTNIATMTGPNAAIGLLPLPFSGPWFATAVDPAGFIWAQSARGSSVLKKFPIGQCAPVAQLTLSAETPAIPAPVRDSARAALARFPAAAGGALPKDLVLPDRFPPFFTLHVDDRHRLWVQRFGPGGEQVMEVFDSAGVAVARVDNFPLNARGPLLFQQGRVYGFVADESGVKHLVALAIQQ